MTSRCHVVVLAIVLWCAFTGRAQATIVFQDTFETYADGDSCTEILATGPWYDCRQSLGTLTIATSIPGYAGAMPSGTKTARVYVDATSAQADVGLNTHNAALSANDNAIPADVWIQVAIFINNGSGEVTSAGNRPMKFFYPCRDVYPCSTNLWLIETVTGSSYEPYCGAALSGNTSGDQYLTLRDAFLYEINDLSPVLTFTVDSSTDVLAATAHGRGNGDKIYFITSGTYPTVADSPVLDALTPYYVVSATANTFKLSRTVGGAALDFTSNGTGTHTGKSRIFQSTDVYTGGCQDRTRLGQTELSDYLKAGRWNIVRMHANTSNTSANELDMWVGSMGGPLIHIMQWHHGDTVNSIAFQWYTEASNYVNGHRSMWLMGTQPANNTPGEIMYSYLDDFYIATSESDLPSYGGGSPIVSARNLVMRNVVRFGSVIGTWIGSFVTCVHWLLVGCWLWMQREKAVLWLSLYRYRRAVKRWQAQAPTMIADHTDTIILNLDRSRSEAIWRQ